MSNFQWTGTTSTDFNTTTNWLGGAVPNASAAVYFTAGSLNNIDTNLDQSATTWTSLNTDMSFNSLIGNADSAVLAYLKTHVPLINLGLPSPTGTPSGSGKVYIDNGANATTVNVYGGANSPHDAYSTPYRLLGSSITTINALAGIIGVALSVGETSTVTTTTVDGGTVIFGAGATHTTINEYAGSITSFSTNATTTANIYSNYTWYGTGAITTLNIFANGNVNYEGTGTITNLNLNGGTIDFSSGTGAVTVSNCTRYPNGRVIDPNKRVTWSAGIIDAGGASMVDNHSVFGSNRTTTIS